MLLSTKLINLKIFTFSIIGSRTPKENNDKRNFLADAMREMEIGGKPLNVDSTLKKAPNVIRVVMRPEIPPKRLHHRKHRKKHLGSLASVLKLAVGLSKFNKERNTNKTAVRRVNTENTLQETVKFLEKVNGQLENMSKSEKNGEHKMTSKASSKTAVKGKGGIMVTDSFPLLTELRSIVEHGKPFDPDMTRAAFARAKQIVWESVGQDPTNTDVSLLNNTKLTNAVALLDMAVREAQKMQRNKTENVDQGTSVHIKAPETTRPITTAQESKHDAHHLKILKELLLEELKQANANKSKTGVLISDIPIQKQRSNEHVNLMQKLPSAAHNHSLDFKAIASPNNQKTVGGARALLENYTSFINNILKDAHLSVLKNLTSEINSAKENSTSLNFNIQTQTRQPGAQTQNLQHQSLGQSTANQQMIPHEKQHGKQQLSFAHAAQEQKQGQERKQHFQQPVLSSERLAARKAFGTAQKLVKAFLARQELYKAEEEFFQKIHDMLNITSSNNGHTFSPVNNTEGYKVTNQPTTVSPIQSPLNTANTSPVGGEGNQKQTSEAQKKFEEAAHLEEKVAAQQDDMYDALMGHTSRTIKGGGGFDEEGDIHETQEQDGVDDSYNTEDYGDFKDSDEEAERKFYHDHRQGDFEAKAEEDSSFSLRNKISTFPNLESLSSTEVSGSGLSYGMSGYTGDDFKHFNMQDGQNVNNYKIHRKAFKSR